MGLSYSHVSPVAHIFSVRECRRENTNLGLYAPLGSRPKRRGVDPGLGHGVVRHPAMKLVFELATFGLHLGFEFL